jgi:hypothetical protein
MLVTSYYIISGFVIWNVGYYPWQREMLAANHWLSKNLPSDAKIGSFNAGIYAFYSNRQVVNLDGVVNHSAFEAIKGRNILLYLDQEKVSYIIDYDSAIKGEYRPFMGSGYPEQLEEITTLGGRIDSPLGLLRVYRLVAK